MNVTQISINQYPVVLVTSHNFPFFHSKNRTESIAKISFSTTVNDLARYKQEELDALLSRTSHKKPLYYLGAHGYSESEKWVVDSGEKNQHKGARNIPIEDLLSMYDAGAWIIDSCNPGGHLLKVNIPCLYPLAAIYDLFLENWELEKEEFVVIPENYINTPKYRSYAKKKDKTNKKYPFVLSGIPEEVYKNHQILFLPYFLKAVAELEAKTREEDEINLRINSANIPF